MPAIHPRPDGCVCEVRNDIGMPVGSCAAPPTRRATWRFERGPVPILLCDLHAAELRDHERLTLRR